MNDANPIEGFHCAILVRISVIIIYFFTLLRYHSTGPSKHLPCLSDSSSNSHFSCGSDIDVNFIIQTIL